MSTKVFLSWSGDLSRQAAEVFKEWLEIVIQELEVFYSEDDIAKGTNGIKTIFSNLQESVASVIMLTKENQTSPWICFEAGAMMSKQEGNACGLLLDFPINELEGPLQNLQQTRLEKKDVYKLLKTLNTKCSAPLSEEKLKRAFNYNWESLYQDLTKLMENSREDYPRKAVSPQPIRPANGKKTIAADSLKAEEDFHLRALRTHREKIFQLLAKATEFNNSRYEWSIGNMADAMEMSITEIEALTEIAIKNGMLSRRFDCTRGGKPVRVYKITPAATIILHNLSQD